MDLDSRRPCPDFRSSLKMRHPHIEEANDGTVAVVCAECATVQEVAESSARFVCKSCAMRWGFRLCPLCGRPFIEAGSGGSRRGRGVWCPHCQERSHIPLFRRDLTPTTAGAWLADFDEDDSDEDEDDPRDYGIDGKDSDVTEPPLIPESLFVADELSKLADLRDRGVLSQEEFDIQKSHLIGATTFGTPSPSPLASGAVPNAVLPLAPARPIHIPTPSAHEAKSGIGQHGNVVFVQPLGNGFAITALVCGIIGAVVGLIPILAVPALIMGILALVFGIAGWKRANKLRAKKGIAVAGVVLGVLAVTLSIVGFVIVHHAFSSLDHAINSSVGNSKSTVPHAPGRTATTQPIAEVGAKLTTRDGATVQVFSYGTFVRPIPPGLAQGGVLPQEEQGIDVQGCASMTGSATSFNPLYFTLKMTDNTTAPVELGAVDRQIDSSDQSAGSCVRGAVGFQVPDGEIPAEVIFQPPGVENALRWSVNPGRFPVLHGGLKQVSP